MRNIFYVAVLTILTLGSSAQAAEPDVWVQWTEGRKADKVNLIRQIDQMQGAYPAFCAESAKGDVNRKACIAAYKMLIVEAQVIVAEIDFQLAAVMTSPRNRDELLKITPAEEMQGERDVAKRRTGEIGRFFSGFKAASTSAGQKN